MMGPRVLKIPHDNFGNYIAPSYEFYEKAVTRSFPFKHRQFYEEF